MINIGKEEAKHQVEGEKDGGKIERKEGRREDKDTDFLFRLHSFLPSLSVPPYTAGFHI